MGLKRNFIGAERLRKVLSPIKGGEVGEILTFNNGGGRVKHGGFY